MKLSTTGLDYQKLVGTKNEKNEKVYGRISLERILIRNRKLKKQSGLRKFLTNPKAKLGDKAREERGFSRERLRRRE